MLTPALIAVLALHRPHVLVRRSPRGAAAARLPRLAAAHDAPHVLFVVPTADDALSEFGQTSPRPQPSWRVVAEHLAERIPNFDARLRARVAYDGDLVNAPNADVVLALGSIDAAGISGLLSRADPPRALLCHGCANDVAALEFIDTYASRDEGSLLSTFRRSLIPWGRHARAARLVEQVHGLLARASSEDYLYATFFVIHAYVLEMDLVRHSINPTWEKGVLRNVREFASMIKCCGPQIFAALTDPVSKTAIDALNGIDSRDQVGSYRVIVSYESELIEDFSLCILQQNNCFNCDSKILESPRVPLMRQWRGKPIDERAARQLLIGHLDVPEAHESASKRLPWSWRIVCGANPAYDAFPCQHQIFYPSESSASALWYDPVFLVETVDGRLVWCKRHYRCSPRTVPSELAGEGGTSAGAWTLTTLDNGVVSLESWTTVDAADDLSWAVLHYSGAASRVGQSYVGALLCSADGHWPASAASGEELARIERAFAKCDLALWELYGHGPPEGAPPGGASFMWNDQGARADWVRANPPPLAPIGDMSVQAWRKQQKGLSATD
mmetsp:Transcript_21246/g.54752  ORF Transcript_21246/g.54752 Transcript_21246/m.54752 type:complete len:558 (-) Transcript_21246:1748-3421(-)